MKAYRALHNTIAKLGKPAHAHLQSRYWLEIAADQNPATRQSG